MSGYAYMAAPYSSPEPNEVEDRYRACMKKQAELVLAGECVFSPIGHSHYLEVVTGKQPHEFWMGLDRPLLRHASKLYVLMLPGWQYSRGVKEEMDIAAACGIPIEYLEP